MARFEIYEHTFEIDGEEYTIQPLSTRYLSDLVSVSSGLSKLTDDEGNLVEEIPSDKLEVLRTCAVETLKQSYPKEDEQKLEQFASQNLMKLIEPLITVNLNPQKED
jgi:hypothetical protein